MELTYDVVVVGGGPGGLAAAEAAARAGCSVLAIEKSHEIGSPIRTSGGSFVRELRDLGIPDRLFHPIHRCRFLSPHEEADFRYDQPVACIIDVRGVYQFLAEQAIAAGAKLWLAATAQDLILDGPRVIGVRVQRERKPAVEIRSKVLIDASGYRGSMLKSAGINPGAVRFGVGAEYDLYAPHYDQKEALLIVGSQVAPSGYAWMFPWGNHRVRVGVGIIHPDSSLHPDAFLDKLIADPVKLGVNLTGAQPVEYHYGLIPSSGYMEPIVGDGILGVGDAAGQPSALVGEGIRWAIQAGRMGGAAAAASVQQGDSSAVFLSHYQKQWNSAFGANLRIAYEINKRIAAWDDQHWDRRTKLLKLMSPDQFARALKTDFSAGWITRLLFANPQLVKEGFREIAKKLGVPM